MLVGSQAGIWNAVISATYNHEQTVLLEMFSLCSQALSWTHGGPALHVFAAIWPRHRCVLAQGTVSIAAFVPHAFRFYQFEFTYATFAGTVMVRVRDTALQAMRMLMV